MKHIEECLKVKGIRSIIMYPFKDGMFSAMIEPWRSRRVLVMAKTLADLDEEIIDKVEEVLYG